MSPAEFRKRIAATNMPINSPTAQACRLCLVDGMSAYAAGKQIGVSQPAVSRARRLLEDATPSDHCPKCGARV